MCVKHKESEREGDLGLLHHGFQEKTALKPITIKIIHVQLVLSVCLSLSRSSLFFCLRLSV